jgi:hypothetical protein
MLTYAHVLINAGDGPTCEGIVCSRMLTYAHVLINAGDGPTCEGIARGAAAEACAGTAGCNAGSRPRELGGGCRRRRAAGRLLLLCIYFVMLSYIYMYTYIHTYIRIYV